MLDLIAAFVIQTCEGNHKQYLIQDQVVPCYDYYINDILNRPKIYEKALKEFKVTYESTSNSK